MKFGEKGDDYISKMRSEMDELQSDAMNFLNKNKNEKGCKELIAILNQSINK